MNRKKRILSTVLEAGLLIALIAGLSYLLQQRSIFGGPSSTEAQSTPIPGMQENKELPSQPYPAPSEVIPTKSTAQRPSTCHFNNPMVSDSEAVKPKLDYSEPKVVLTHDAEIGIAGWLPDNERLLITQDTSGDQSSIETFNVISSEIQTYAKRNGSMEKPVWFNEKNGAIFTTYTNDHYEIWISYGSLEKLEQISNDGSSFSLSPDEKQLLYLSQSKQYQLQVWDTSSKLSQPLSIDLRNWEYNRYSNTISVDIADIHRFQSAWSPDSSNIVFYTNPWVFMFDRNTNQLCEIDLGEKDFPRWAFNVQWSPNGQFLAMLTTTSLPGMLYSSSELILIDLSTGNSQIINIATDSLLKPSSLRLTGMRQISWTGI